MSDGTAVRIVPGAIHTDRKTIAETTVTNGEFVLELTLEEPLQLNLLARGMREATKIMAAPGDKITISGTLANPVVKGGALQEEYMRKYVEPRNALDKRHTDNQVKYADISRRMGEAREAGDQEAQATIKTSEEWQAYMKAENDVFNSLSELYDRSVEENAGTFWGPLLMLSHTSFLTPDNEKHYNMLSEEAKNSYYGKLVAEEIFGKTGTAPVFMAKDADGKEHSLKDLLKDNNYVLIDFWASWCAPCRKFVPTLKQLAEKYADKGLVVVSISTDKDRAAWLGALREENMPWLNLQDDGTIGNSYGVTSIPSLFLIDPNGEIVFGKQNGQNVVDKLAEVFEN